MSQILATTLYVPLLTTDKRTDVSWDMFIMSVSKKFVVNAIAYYYCVYYKFLWDRRYVTWKINSGIVWAAGQYTKKKKKIGPNMSNFWGHFFHVFKGKNYRWFWDFETPILIALHLCTQLFHSQYAKAHLDPILAYWPWHTYFLLFQTGSNSLFSIYIMFNCYTSHCLKMRINEKKTNSNFTSQGC